MCLLRSWCWSMALGQPICLEAKNSAKRRGDYIHIWTETYIIGFLYICRQHITISPYDHTHAQPRTRVHTHIYVHRHAQHEHSTYTSSQHHVLKHHLTHHNFTSNATRSVYLRLHTFTLLPPNLTWHENNITSHTHTHTYNIHMYITYITNCLLHPVHISLTHYQSDTPVHAHTYIHTNSPTITPPSLSYFLFPCCFSMLSLSLVKLLTCGVIRSYNLIFFLLLFSSLLWLFPSLLFICPYCRKFDF